MAITTLDKVKRAKADDGSSKKVYDRSYLLRQQYWQGTYKDHRIWILVDGSESPEFIGFGENFVNLLDSSEPAILPHDLLAGISISQPSNRQSCNLGEYDPHYPPGHAKILKMGFAGIRDAARLKLQTESDVKKRNFLEGIVISYDAACRYAQRTAKYLDELAENESDDTRSTELEQISKVCRQIAEGPPTTFHAALQTVWFTHMFGARGCIGRFDQWMYPFFRRDVESGIISRAHAQELLESLWIKLNYFAGNNDSLRNISLAGQTPEGNDASNELTYMCLDATAKLKLPEPKLNLRFFSGSPPELLEAGCRVICQGLSQPSIFNDDVAIPALVNLGIPLEIARNYCNDGCEELVAEGCGTMKFRVIGTIPIFDETVRAAAEGKLQTFEDVKSDFKRRLVDLVPTEKPDIRQVTHPFFGATIDDCLDKASPDGVRYTIYSIIPSQLAHVADGLAAIKQHVFDEKSLTWGELLAALDDNYLHYETLRQRLLHNSPKYGNDNDEADLLIREIAEHFCDETHRLSHNSYGPGPKRTVGFMNFGLANQRDAPACPDGRKLGEDIPNSFSPALGRDRNGPTAVLKSAAKTDMTKAGHGSVLDITFNTSSLKGPESFEKFKGFVRAFLDMPCTATLQVNTVDQKTLLEARENPDDPRFRTLLVRVWGFSTVFVELDPLLQEHVLGRLEHAI